MVGYLLDTYALIEIVKGNPAYKRYAQAKAYTTIFNLYELYVQLLKQYGEIIAKKEFEVFKQIKILIKDNHIFRAASFKLKYKKSVSYTDALGYAIAGMEGLHFLTGDNGFKGLKNVEFVK